LDALVEPYRQRIEIQTKVLIGVPFLEIVREVLRSGHDLVIKTPETQDWLDRFFGSDDMHLLRKCPCPIWLIKPEAPKAYRRILAAVDVDDRYLPAELKTRQLLNRQILEMAGSLALSEFAELHVAHAWDAIGESVMRGAFMYEPEEKVLAYVEHVRSQHEANLAKLLQEVTIQLGQGAVDYLEPRIGKANQGRSHRHGHGGPHRRSRVHHGQYRGNDSESDRLFSARNQAAWLRNTDYLRGLIARADPVPRIGAFSAAEPYCRDVARTARPDCRRPYAGGTVVRDHCSCEPAVAGPSIRHFIFT
jgi:hypothetical protein